jgi:ABC-2 type transport system ATP-binding protein
MEPAAARDVTLQLQGLSKSYGDVTAVRDLSLEVRRGEVFGLLGPNGAGKTTTISMVCGLLRPDAGAILLDGRPLRRDGRAARASLGLCPQDLVIWGTLTCAEQLEFVGRQYDLGRRAARRRADEMLGALGLQEKRDRLARTLSGGLKRRLNIALALVHDPPVLVLDEPQAGLDPQSRVLVREYVASLARSKTVILTTHDMDEVDRMAERVAIIDRGRLLVLDTPAALKSRVGTGDVLEIAYAGGADLDAERLRRAVPEATQSLAVEKSSVRVVARDALDLVPPLLDEMRAAGADARDIRLRKKTLEDVFLALTGRSLRE